LNLRPVRLRALRSEGCPGLSREECEIHDQNGSFILFFFLARFRLAAFFVTATFCRGYSSMKKHRANKDILFARALKMPLGAVRDNFVCSQMCERSGTPQGFKITYSFP
jgi:hypothetical protein